jgi:hypothetical protein
MNQIQDIDIIPEKNIDQVKFLITKNSGNFFTSPNNNRLDIYNYWRFDISSIIWKFKILKLADFTSKNYHGIQNTTGEGFTYNFPKP